MTGVMRDGVGQPFQPHGHGTVEDVHQCLVAEGPGAVSPAEAHHVVDVNPNASCQPFLCQQPVADGLCVWAGQDLDSTLFRPSHKLRQVMVPHGRRHL
jgi:hypothetical protein